MTVSLIKKILLHTVGLVGFAIILGIATGLVAGLATSNPQAAAAWSAAAYFALILLLPVGLWIVVVTFFDQDRELYEEWGPALAVTVIPAVLGALAARFAFVGPATTAAVIVKPRLGAGALTVAMAEAFGWSQILAVLAATVAGAVLIAAWARRQDPIRHWRK